MPRLLIDCTGAEIGKLYVPPFQLRSGEVVSLHMPGPALSSAEELLISRLTGDQPIPGINRLGSVMYADCMFMSLQNRWQKLSFIFHRPLIVDRLRRLAGIPRREAEEVARRHGVSSLSRVAGISGNERVLLALEVVWARRADVALFTTTGIQAEVIYKELARRLDQSAALELCYESWSQGRKQRYQFPGATAVELSWTEPVPVSTI